MTVPDYATKALCRSIVGIENRTAQEVHDIMCDRIRFFLSTLPIAGEGKVKALDWSNFDGPTINKDWKPTDQDLIYEALNFVAGDYGDADDNAAEQIIELLLTAWRASLTSSTVKALVWEYREQQMMTYVVRDYRGIVYHINQTFGSDSYYFTTVKFDGSILYDGDDLPSAQAAAQADHDAFVLSSLTFSPGKDGGQEVEEIADSGPASVPGGWALVPVKMNADMINAWSGGLTVTTDEIAYQTSFQEAWKRVLAAAPSAKAEVDISALVRRLRSLVSYHVSTEINPKGWTWYVAPDAPEVIMETIDALSATIAARQEVTAKQASNELTRREEAGVDARVPLTASANVARLSNEQLKAIATHPQPASTALVERPQVLKGVGKINGDGWKDTTKVGEVVFVWNEELPPPYKPGQFPRIGCEHYTASTDQYDFTPASISDIRAYLNAAKEGFQS